MKQRALVLVSAAVAVALISAGCVGGGNPPPSPVRDVLVLGDSLGWPLGCVLGHQGQYGLGSSCNPLPDLTTRNQWEGGCQISGGAVLKYSGEAQTTFACSNWQSQWSALADQVHPKVVIIATSGWEIVDRWSSFPGSCTLADARSCVTPPDEQWGGAGTAPDPAIANYTAKLAAAINLFRNKPWHPTVVVANSVYVNPPAAEGPSADDLWWWEPYGPSAPPDWVAPNVGVTFRASRTKVDQFNAAIQSVKTTSFASDSKVLVFDYWRHFDPGGAWNAYVCPPPNDFSEVPNTSVDPPTCTNGNAIIARVELDSTTHESEGSHISAAGLDILAYYLQPCVRALLGKPGGDMAKCS